MRENFAGSEQTFHIIILSILSLVPLDFLEHLEKYTEKGYRVLALAYKSLGSLSYVKAQKMPREEAEKDLTMLGLVILENKLKAETRGIVRQLKDAQFRTIMVTGNDYLDFAAKL